MMFLQTCIGLNSCSVTVDPEIFGGDPCPNIMKKLSVEAVCSWRPTEVQKLTKSDSRQHQFRHLGFQVNWIVTFNTPRTIFWLFPRWSWKIKDTPLGKSPRRFSKGKQIKHVHKSYNYSDFGSLMETIQRREFGGSTSRRNQFESMCAWV